MKITKFKASKVYDYLEFDINFDANLTFLTGVNGSGKSTIIKLIQALLTPSLSDLLSIPFSDVSLSYTDGGQEVLVKALKENENLELIVSNNERKMKIQMKSTDEYKFISARSMGEEEIFEYFNRKYADHDVFKFLTNVNPPMILGLDRTHKDILNEPEEYYVERNYLKKTPVNYRFRKIFKGSLAAGLFETQDLIQDAYRRLRREEDKYWEELRESILVSSFNYAKFNVDEDFKGQVPLWTEKNDLKRRKGEIQAALTNIGVSSERTETVLEEFFSQLNNLFDNLRVGKDQPGFNIEWIINKAQIERLSGLIKVIDDHKAKIDVLYKPITRFLETINSFYLDTKKKLEIDTVGHLIIIRADGSFAEIEALSSGERQLLIIFAHLSLNEYAKKSNVFIIDEPELSLHLRWQERFVDTAINVNSSNQLILATHSPEIIAGFEQKAIDVGKNA
ncbi:AAA family ATPase [Leptospira dzoumogneensis]|uniref:AAA+ ATPase domain-containing protein n=1 Tax=Leptospira dzoumogneensis TaxID=2484904 RepID=A0A4Z1AGE4_9LEPT|nr:AAA family ATPase [Leptospira dzoumogneensis]TGM97313.1 hypothetical protein EHR06_14280 [Leptospira dzoumogneensis]